MWKCTSCGTLNNDAQVRCASCSEDKPQFCTSESLRDLIGPEHVKKSRPVWKTALLWAAGILVLILTQGVIKPLMRDYRRGWYKITTETSGTHSVGGLRCTAPGRFTGQPLTVTDPEESRKLRDFFSNITDYENPLPGLNLSIIHYVARPSNTPNLDGAVSGYIAGITKSYSPDQYKCQTYMLEVSGTPAQLIDISLMSGNQSRGLALIFVRNGEAWYAQASYPLSNTYATDIALNFLRSVRIQN